MLQAHWRGCSARRLFKQHRSAQVAPPSGQFQPATTRLPVPLSASSAIGQRWVIRPNWCCLCIVDRVPADSAKLRLGLDYTVLAAHPQATCSVLEAHGRTCMLGCGGWQACSCLSNHRGQLQIPVCLPRLQRTMASSSVHVYYVVPAAVYPSRVSCLTQEVASAGPSLQVLEAWRLMWMPCFSSA